MHVPTAAAGIVVGWGEVDWWEIGFWHCLERSEKPGGKLMSEIGVT